MTHTIQHDPKTKQNIKAAIFDYLYDPAKKQFNAKVGALIVKNSTALGNSEGSFTYKGEIYQLAGASLSRKMNRLVRELQPIMDGYLEELAHLNNYELPHVLGFIGQVLNASNALQDYLLVLPEAVHPPIHEMIAKCPSRTNKLTLSDIESFKKKNSLPISLMKQRLVTNLII